MSAAGCLPAPVESGRDNSWRRDCSTRHKGAMTYAQTLGGTRYVFDDLRTLLARATPFRSGDALAGLAAATAAERVAAQMALADLPLATILVKPVVPYETDEVTRLIIDSHDAAAFAPVASLTVGEFREYLLAAEPEVLAP